MSQATGPNNRILRALFRERGRSRGHHIDIPVHGSCSRCHHFHINCLVPHDTTAHTRVRCEQCGHQMFGLGSSNTQYTLASVNTGTMFHPRGCVEEQPRQAGSQGETVAVVDTQNATLHSPTPDHHLSSPTNQMAEGPDQAHQGNMQEPLRHTMRKRLKQWCSRPRKWSSSIRAVVQRLSNTARGAGPASSTINNVSISASPPPSLSQTPPGVPAGDASEPVTRPESPSFPRHRDQQGEPTRERLSILRQEKTEQRERELPFQCLCHQHCFCMNEGSRASNVAYIGNESQTPSRMQIEETWSSPSSGSPTSKGISQETSLLHIGHHFDDQGAMSPDRLGLTAENSQRRNRSIQTLTTDTNRSSLTLSGGTASGATRYHLISSSNPTPEPHTGHRLPAISYDANSNQDPAERRMVGALGSGRSGLAPAVQNHAVLDPNPLSTSQASFGSSPRHDSQVGHKDNAEGTSLQVDGIASEHTREEESEAATSTG